MMSKYKFDFMSNSVRRVRIQCLQFTNSSSRCETAIIKAALNERKNKEHPDTFLPFESLSFVNITFKSHGGTGFFTGRYKFNKPFKNFLRVM